MVYVNLCGFQKTRHLQRTTYAPEVCVCWDTQTEPDRGAGFYI